MIYTKTKKSCITFIKKNSKKQQHNKSLAVCMLRMDKQCSFYAKDLSLVVKRQRVRCAWPLCRSHTSVFCDV